ncbi:MAG: hypothetical protein AB1499_07500 [Nitrospirota bacterium]
MKVKKSEKQYIRHDRYENLHVVPYIRGRLMFAYLAARAIEEDGFEQVLVDLPFFLNNGGLWEKAVTSFPRTSSLLVKKDDATFAVFPFVPSDASCMALAAVRTMREWGRAIELKCVDDSHIIHYSPEFMIRQMTRPRDDYFVMTEGLDGYLGHLEPQITDSWNSLADDQRAINECRAGMIGERIRSCLKGGKKTLFVCEYSLWWSVRKTLDAEYSAGNYYFPYKWRDMQAAFVHEDPFYLWKQGALDDYPAVVKRFYDRFQAASLKRFDKLDEINELIKYSLGSAGSASGSRPSLRKTLSFYQYLRNRTAADLRLTPQVVRHLYDSALSFMGKKFAGALMKRCLEYPYMETARIQDYIEIRQNAVYMGAGKFNIPDYARKYFLHTGSDRYSFESFHDDVENVQMFNTVYKILSRDEQALLSHDRGYSWELKKDFKLIESTCSKARQNISKKDCRQRSSRSWGSMGEGIDWKATINSKSLNEDSVHVMMKIIDRNSRLKLNEFTPVTFLFSEDMKGHSTFNLEEGNAVYLDYAAGDLSYEEYEKRNGAYVEYGFATYSATSYYYRDHIKKYDLSSLTLLYTRAILKEQRYDQLMKRPKRFHCRRRPLDDPDLSAFRLSELGIAWAIKYADGSVMVIAGDRWKPSARLTEFAKKRRIKIDFQPLSGFNPGLIERMKNFYLISSALEKHPARDSIVERLIE